MTDNNQELTYKEHRQTLIESCEKIEAMDFPDIDAIIPIMSKGLNSHKAMKSSIEKVQAYINDLDA